jgi:hypothetical protein
MRRGQSKTIPVLKGKWQPNSRRVKRKMSSFHPRPRLMILAQLHEGKEYATQFRKE